MTNIVVGERRSNICIIGVCKEDNQNKELKQTVDSLIKLHWNERILEYAY